MSALNQPACNQPAFQLDGVLIPFQPGATIMAAALAAQHYIPHLCHHPDYAPSGNCRVCLVQANGQLAAACTTLAQADLIVTSDSEPLRNLRRGIVQMLFVEGNHICPGCEASGSCQLQAIAYSLQMLSPCFQHAYPQRPVDMSHTEVWLDHNRCILCGLCVRASAAEGKAVFRLVGRGQHTRLQVNSPSGQLADSAIAATDKAVRVCPVGALMRKKIPWQFPIGQRLYDQAPIALVGDRADPHEHD